MPDRIARDIAPPLRLLPWTTPDGKPCYLATDGGDSYLSRRADEVEALQLHMGTALLDHARALLDDRKAGPGELRYLANRLRVKRSATPCGSRRAGATGWSPLPTAATARRDPTPPRTRTPGPRPRRAVLGGPPTGS
ncbi:hypothetical protein [Streptomyces malaysiensis]|uniref:hypothetical protein n=1 Tax=Streptomyces malaysiensis TaxID=92644 RepID=UPI002B285AA8|nr:hypothetical protein R8789_21690 [Streptomyces malaysiensis]